MTAPESRWKRHKPAKSAKPERTKGTQASGRREPAKDAAPTRPRRPAHKAALPDNFPESWRPVDLAALEDARPPTPDLLVADGVAIGVRGERHVLNGPPESMKTWIAAAIAAQEIAERSGRVLWINTDGMPNARVVERLAALGVPRDQINARLLLLSPDESPEAGGAEALLEALGPTLLVVDSFDATAELLGLGTWKTSEIEAAYRAIIGPFHYAGIPSIVIDHPRKNGGDSGAGGSGRKLGIVEQQLTCMPLGKERMRRSGGATVVELKLGKDRNGAYGVGSGETVATITFSSDGRGRVSWTLEPGGTDYGAFRPSGYMQRVSEYLELITEAPWPSGKKIQQDVKGKTPHKRTAIDLLLKEGWIERQGRYGHRSVRPFREADDPGPPESESS